MLVLAVHKLAEASAKVPFSMVVSVLPQLHHMLVLMFEPAQPQRLAQR